MDFIIKNGDLKVYGKNKVEILLNKVPQRLFLVKNINKKSHFRDVWGSFVGFYCYRRSDSFKILLIKKVSKMKFYYKNIPHFYNKISFLGWFGHSRAIPERLWKRQIPMEETSPEDPETSLGHFWTKMISSRGVTF